MSPTGIRVEFPQDPIAEIDRMLELIEQLADMVPEWNSLEKEEVLERIAHQATRIRLAKAIRGKIEIRAVNMEPRRKREK